MGPALKLDFPIPPEADRGYVGGGDFLQIGDDFRDLFVRLGGLRWTDSVLDVGCGIGRMALALVGHLAPTARYEGFDIVRHGVEWCQKNISPRWNNFKFSHSDIYNKCYNPKGKLSSRSYRFPYSDNSFDFVFLTSVFTHMGQRDTEHYLGEIHRVLKPQGKAFITFFIINNDARKWIGEGKSVFQFMHHNGPCWYEKPQCPEEVIGFEEEYLRGLFHDSGFGNWQSWPGMWNGRPNGETGQDVVLVEKTGQPSPQRLRKRKWLSWLPW